MSAILFLPQCVNSLLLMRFQSTVSIVSLLLTLLCASNATSPYSWFLEWYVHARGSFQKTKQSKTKTWRPTNENAFQIINAPKTEIYHDAAVVTVGIADFRDDNLRCHQWRQSWRHADSRFLVSPAKILRKFDWFCSKHHVGWWFCTMMTSSNENIFRVTGHLCGEFTGHAILYTIAQEPRTLMFSLMCAWINGWVNNGEAGDLSRHRAHYDVTVIPSGTRISCGRGEE